MSILTNTGSKALLATCITSICLLSGCSLLPSRVDAENALKIQALMLDLGSCQFDNNEHKAMYQAASAGNRLPFPLLLCEGKRSESFDERWQASRRAVGYHILDSHFEDNGTRYAGYGAALIEISMPDWGAACINLGYDDNTCDHLVYGINAPHIQKVSAAQVQNLLRKQNKLAQVTNIPIIKDTILMPLKHNAKGKLIANWVEDGGAQITTKALADKLGEEVFSSNGKPLPISSYNLQYDLLQQKDLPLQYRGVFYYATPQYIDYSNRPSAEYSIPLRNGVQVRGYKTAIYRALPN
ncbi:MULTISPECIES: hypothetical protein [unclassified Shewanella]|uniref:hypothetical protein n=1 Tax=unclassified Shewanella TaxID=196818 RepID=UPI001BBBEC03|nr:MULTISPECIES: hypothetical protein [unclassified Shewanella]GIU10049.1 hypothetical protein TUM4444_13660 [Shewanella sp. MBTL60-112-B1]GIU40876.1 hypothetical protein TUM4445_40920 [Shewanella sp. MBTL60-112-B2]